MSRFARRVDANHGQIVLALRGAGAVVASLASVGKGVPDLLVGHQGRWLLVEIKDGRKAPSQRRLTTAEFDFADVCQRKSLPWYLAECQEDALAILSGGGRSLADLPGASP